MTQTNTGDKNIISHNADPLKSSPLDQERLSRTPALKEIENLKNILNGTPSQASEPNDRHLKLWPELCKEWANPKDTSITCPACGLIDKGNCNGDSFKCLGCSY